MAHDDALENLDAAADALRESLERGGGVLAVTGAGVSAESGMPTFRGAANAAHGADPDDERRPLWERYSPADLATPEAFARDPALVGGWYRWRLEIVRGVNPNPGHEALARLEWTLSRAGGRFTLATQNVDGLHRRAGSGTHGGELLELHGSIELWRTGSGDRTYEGDELDAVLGGEPPYRCPASGELVRPGVVWFGEALPERAIGGALRAAESCALFLSVGTSATVYPAAGLVEVAASACAATIEINAEATPASDVVDHTLRGRSGEILPRLLHAAGVRSA
mgnify:CR=1 FL=1